MTAPDNPRSVTAAVRARRMTRAFAPTPLPTELVDSILDTARRAPSAGNTNPVEFLVLDSPETVDAYWSTTFTTDGRARFRWQQLFDAPVLVVITTRPNSYPERYAEADKARPGLGDSTDDWPVPFWWVDAGAVAQNLLLLAVEHGLGACLFGLFDHEAAVATRFAVPADRRLVATIALGQPRPDEPGRSANRRRADLDGVVHRGYWDPS